MSNETELGRKMRALASSGHPRAEELRERAKVLDEEVARAYATETPDSLKRWLSAWAKARRVWSECSGEPLI